MGGLSARAKQRLRLLAGLLRSKGHNFDTPRDKFYDGAIAETWRLMDGELPGDCDPFLRKFRTLDELQKLGPKR